MAMMIMMTVMMMMMMMMMMMYIPLPFLYPLLLNNRDYHPISKITRTEDEIEA